jgi:hypothetical protein
LTSVIATKRAILWIRLRLFPNDTCTLSLSRTHTLIRALSHTLSLSLTHSHTHTHTPHNYSIFLPYWNTTKRFVTSRCDGMSGELWHVRWTLSPQGSCALHFSCIQAKLIPPALALATCSTQTWSSRSPYILKLELKLQSTLSASFKLEAVLVWLSSIADCIKLNTIGLQCRWDWMINTLIHKKISEKYEVVNWWKCTHN